MSTAVVVLIALGLSIATVFADMLIKRASLQAGFAGWHCLVVTIAIYVATVFGWFFLTRHMKLFALNAIYSVSILVCLSLVSVFYFKEKINTIEVVGLGMAITSVVLLTAFSKQ